GSSTSRCSTFTTTPASAARAAASCWVSPTSCGAATVPPPADSATSRPAAISTASTSAPTTAGTARGAYRPGRGAGSGSAGTASGVARVVATVSASWSNTVGPVLPRSSVGCGSTWASRPTSVSGPGGGRWRDASASASAIVVASG